MTEDKDNKSLPDIFDEYVDGEEKKKSEEKEKKEEKTEESPSEENETTPTKDEPPEKIPPEQDDAEAHHRGEDGPADRDFAELHGALSGSASGASARLSIASTFAPGKSF